MKKNTCVLLIALCLLTGCESTSVDNSNITETESVISTTEMPSTQVHTHSYTDVITTEATCEEDGVKTFTCECGDSYTEPISATGHIFENYIYNEDATYLAEGTETATCICGLTDTRSAEGSKLEYSYTDSDKTMWTNSSVNVRNLPSEDGDELGVLSKAQEVHITGHCLETDWYRIEYNGAEAYVSNNYLQDSKPVSEERETPPIQSTTSSEQTAQGQQSSSGNAKNGVCPYELYVIYYDNKGYPYYYGKWGGSANMDAENYAKTEDCDAQISEYMGDNYMIWNEDHTSGHVSSMTGWQFIGTYQGMPVVVRYIANCNEVNPGTPEERGISTAGNGIW